MAEEQTLSPANAAAKLDVDHAFFLPGSEARSVPLLKAKEVRVAWAYGTDDEYDELEWFLGKYTWHTNIDTFDKLIFDDLRHNATLAAMTAYMASEDPDRVPRDTRLLPVNARTGQPATWPQCRPSRRAYGN